MLKIIAYCRLMRLDKPTGTVLLWVPTAWALWIANNGLPPLFILMYLFCGTIIMRCAGCVMNDIADRKIDGYVKRTHLRPLAAGEISLKSAIILLIILLCLALIVVLQLPIRCLYLACLSLILTIIYPFCKRFFDAPQFVLGLAFSMGIPMAYFASGVSIDFKMVVLFVLNFIWIVAYDTMYAMVDRDDDLLIGIKSTAVMFGAYDRIIIGILQALLHLGWIYIAVILDVSTFFYVAWFIGFLILLYQQKLIGMRNRDDYFRAFISNGWYGGVIWIGFIISL